MNRITGGVTIVGLLLMALNCFADTTEENAAGGDTSVSGHWVVDPRRAGNNLPPTGRSLFDFVFSKTINGKVEYDIPFPYTRLIQKLEQYVRTDTILDTSVKHVLVPLGRSLARNIARPDFFRYPRVVSVVDTEPAQTGNMAGLMLKDRLYIGYGEAARILEIISYNEADGRFEFQIVTDYKPDGKPQVFYASREVCSACHQNGALIFSRQQWDETNSNPRIAALLKEHQSSFYGIPVDNGVDIPFAIDAATDRANLFALYQLLWQQGCEAAGNNSAVKSPECRKDLLTYTLQYLLSNRSVFNSHSNYYQNTFLPQLVSNWKKHWPRGLLIPDPDIPNRDPLLIKTNTIALSKVEGGKFTEGASSTLNTMLAKNDVPDKFEPLNFRPPLDHWDVQKEGLDSILIAGLASFIPDSDIQKLDRKLATEKKIATSQHQLSCVVLSRNSDRFEQRIKFDCHSDNSQIQAKGRFILRDNQWSTGKISRLTTHGQSQFNLILEPQKLQTGHRSTAVLKLYSSSDFSRQSNKLTARLPDGNAIESLHINWNPNVTDSSTTATLQIRHDFDLLQRVLTGLAKPNAGNKNDGLTNKPFRRAILMKDIMKHLGIKIKNWCCVESGHMPAARLQNPDNEVAIVSQAANPEIAPFYHYCATCHRTPNPQPPNFLQGSETTVAKNINQCAERIFFRLSMWQQKSDDRAKSPMPPATALHRLGFSQHRWSYSDELSSLKHAVARLIRNRTGKSPDLDLYVNQGFENLPECLPTG